MTVSASHSRSERQSGHCLYCGASLLHLKASAEYCDA